MVYQPPPTAPVRRWRSGAVLVVDDERYVLAVSRGDDLSDLSLPGGRRERTDRTPSETAARELLEETGIRALEMEMALITPKACYIYQALAWAGELKSSQEGTAMWVPPELLLRVTSRHAEDTRRVYEAVFRR